MDRAQESGSSPVSGEPIPAAGARWGPFTLGELLWRGQFVTVHRALDHQSGLDVALKIFARDDPRGPALGAALLDESARLAALHHPNLVRVFAAHRHHGQTAVAMELIDGAPIEHTVRTTGPLTTSHVRALGIDACRGLGALHAAGFLHRDIKAANVLRDTGGRHVLIDIGEGRATNRVPPGVIVGTLPYMAPEVLQGSAASPQSDLYAVGALLFYCATLGFPIWGASLPDLQAAHRNGPVLLAEARPVLPRKLVEAVDCALSPDPRDRFASARDFEIALTQATAARVQPPG